MQIPEGREFAANVIFQLSIVSCMFSLTQVPYNALIIAHEKMNIYAYVGIAEAAFKLTLIFVLLYIPFKDNLIAYGIILAAWSVGLQFFYRFYCYKYFPESHLGLCREKSIYKSMLSYSLWDFIGSFCATGNSHGLNLLINMFFGVTVNAGRAIAYQVENALTTFSNNFLTAVNPQIVKSFAVGDRMRFISLIQESSKLSFYLLFLISLPFFLEAPYILKIWLVEVPDTSVFFLRFALYYSLFRVCTRPYVLGVHATGNIKYLNLTSGCYSAGTFLLAIYISYKLGAPYWSCMIVQAFNGIILTYFEVNSLNRNFPFSRIKFLTDNLIKPWSVVLLSCVMPALGIYFLDESIIRLLITFMVSFVGCPLIIFSIGLDNNQKLMIKKIIFSKLLRRTK
jgi:O-antigen/teichoic acid export membrane protein